MSHHRDLDRALAHDDYLDLRRARCGPDAQPGHGRCVILYSYQEACDQCGRMTWKPHVAGPRTFCRRCCPACAQLSATG